MVFFNQCYLAAEGLLRKELPEGASVSLREKPAGTSRWLQWTVTAPLRVCHTLYNVYLMAKHKELHAPSFANINSRDVVNRMPLLAAPFKWWHPTTNFHLLDPLLGKVFTHLPRADKGGAFQSKDTIKIFLPLFKDLYPEDQVDENDFLFTCQQEFITRYRTPIIEHIGSAKIEEHSPLIDEAIDQALDYIEKNETVSATELTEAFTVNVISSVLFGKVLDFERCTEIGRATEMAFQYQLARMWIKPSPELESQYQHSLTVLREIIAQSEGPFQESLNALTPIQKKGLLLLMYIGGTSTTSVTLQHLLWQLGQHPFLQDELHKSRDNEEDHKKLLQGLFAEALRMMPPARYARQANRDLELKAEDKKTRKTLWTHPIYKGDILFVIPDIGARDPKRFPNPNEFNPHRKRSIENAIQEFSDGKHVCPGKALAEAEVKRFIAKVGERFVITSMPQKAALEQKFIMTKQIAEPVTLTFTPRESNKDI